MYFDCNGLPVYYEIIGEGKPIIFLHGWGGEIGSFKPIYEKLSKNYQCVLMDFWGFGKSASLKTPKTLTDYKKSVLKLIQHLNLTKVNIVAHSFGGRVAIRLLSEHQEVFDKAVLFAPAGIKPRFSFKRFFRVSLFKMKKKLWKMGLIKGEFLAKSGSKDYIALGFTMKKTFVNIIGEDLKKPAKKIKNKILLVYGKGDVAVPKYMVKKLNKLIKNSEFFEMENGHFCYLDNVLLSTTLIESCFQ